MCNTHIGKLSLSLSLLILSRVHSCVKLEINNIFVQKSWKRSLGEGKKEKWILRGKNFQLNSFNYFNVSHLSPQSQLDEIF